MNKTPEKTKKEAKEGRLKETAEELGIDLILLFGSRAGTCPRPDSDFDIAYRLSKDRSSKLSELDLDHQIFNALLKYTGSENLHITEMKKDIKPLFLYEIMNNCKVLYAKDMMDFYNLRVYAMRRYEDEVKPLYRIIFEKLKKEYQV